jgi:hypothetical protein
MFYHKFDMCISCGQSPFCSDMFALLVFRKVQRLSRKGVGQVKLIEAPRVQSNLDHDIVQTTNRVKSGSENYSGKIKLWQ